MTSITHSSVSGDVMPLGIPYAHRPRLDAITGLGSAELERRFRAAHPPTAGDFDRLSGDLVLRGLALPGGSVSRRIAARPGFFWTGKSFRRIEEGVTYGHNFFTVLGGARALAFVATIGPSAIDGAPSVHIDYGDPRVRGPRYARWLYDELREIEPGLWLGPGCLRIGGRLVILCWFAVDDTIGFEGRR